VLVISGSSGSGNYDLTTHYVSEFLQFIGLRLVEATPRSAYASERITAFFTAILLGKSHGMSKIRLWRDGIVEFWSPAPLPARRAYRPEGRVYASERRLGMKNGKRSIL
jgi:hypothetical protein